MQVFEYVIQRGDTLGQIAKKFTGSPARWIEMLDSNPQIPRMRNQWGQKVFAPQRFQVGQRIFLPYSWIQGKGVVRGPDGIVNGPASGTVGAGCTPTKVEPHPTAYYLVPDGKFPADVAVAFGQIKDGHGDYGALNGANVGWWAQGFSPNQYGDCVMNGWKGGIVIRIPKKWIDIPQTQLNQLEGLGNLVQADGVTPWTPGGGGGGGGGTPGTQGNCPEGQVLAADGVTCIPKGSGTGVGAKDEGFKASTIVWVLLAAGAGIGGALLLNNLIKAKKVHGVPMTAHVERPMLPAAPVKEEVKIRR